MINRQILGRAGFEHVPSGWFSAGCGDASDPGDVSGLHVKFGMPNRVLPPESQPHNRKTNRTAGAALDCFFGFGYVKTKNR